MKNKSSIIFLFLLLAFQYSIYAATPTWVFTTLNNIRRCAEAGGKAKHAFLVLGKFKHAIPDDNINYLAKIASQKNGLKEVGKILGQEKLIVKYGDELGHIILQDAYLRIAVKNGRISHNVAQKTLSNLGGTPGLTALIRKINSINYSQMKGHYRELEIALKSKERGFSVVSLGQRFDDGFKKADTDLDILLKKGSRNYAIESKAYWGQVPDSMVRDDAESLVAFCEKIGNTTPVFCFESEPSIAARKFLDRRGVKCLVGSAGEIASKLDVFSSAF